MFEENAFFYHKQKIIYRCLLKTCKANMNVKSQHLLRVPLSHVQYNVKKETICIGMFRVNDN